MRLHLAEVSEHMPLLWETLLTKKPFPPGLASSGMQTCLSKENNKTQTL